MLYRLWIPAFKAWFIYDMIPSEELSISQMAQTCWL